MPMTRVYQGTLPDRPAHLANPGARASAGSQALAFSKKWLAGTGSAGQPVLPPGPPARGGQAGRSVPGATVPAGGLTAARNRPFAFRIGRGIPAWHDATPAPQERSAADIAGTRVRPALLVLRVPARPATSQSSVSPLSQPSRPLRQHPLSGQMWLPAPLPSSRWPMPAGTAAPQAPGARTYIGQRYIWLPA